MLRDTAPPDYEPVALGRELFQISGALLPSLSVEVLHIKPPSDFPLLLLGLWFYSRIARLLPELICRNNRPNFLYGCGFQLSLACQLEAGNNNRSKWAPNSKKSLSPNAVDI